MAVAGSSVAHDVSPTPASLTADKGAPRAVSAASSSSPVRDYLGDPAGLLGDHEKYHDLDHRGASLASDETGLYDEPPTVELYPAYKQSTHFKIHQAHILDLFTMPKTGEALERCGSYTIIESTEGGWGRVIACPEHLARARAVPYRCLRPVCPTCADAWARREASGAVERLDASVELYAKTDYPIGEPRHIAFSSPEAIWRGYDFNTAEGYRAFRAKALAMVKCAGIKGGCMVVHLYRQHKHAEDGAPDGVAIGEWYLSPHIHVIGFGWMIPADEYYKKTGWIYKNKGIRENLTGTMSYLLTHCAIQRTGEHEKRIIYAVTWFGVTGYNKVCKKNEVQEHKGVRCDVEGCHGILHVWDVDIDENGAFDMDSAEDVGEYWILKRRRIFYLRNPPAPRLKQTEVSDYG